MTTNTDNRINELFRELVPFKGKADTVAGEIIRAICRIGFRYINDGDQIDIGYGKHTCNPAARYLQSVCDLPIQLSIAIMWGEYNEAEYEELLEELKLDILEFIEKHPELKTTPNELDMLDFTSPEDEDWDDEEDEEDEWAEDWDEEE